MAITAFKKELWSNAIEETYKGITVAGLICKEPVQGGKGYHWTSAGAVTVNDYTGTITYAEAGATDIPCSFDKNKYFAIKIDDIDKCQLVADLLMTQASNASHALKKEEDVAVLSDMAKNAGTSIGTASAKKSITIPEQAYDFVVDLGTALDKKDAPEMGRFVIANAEFVNLMAKDKRCVDNAPVLQNGIVQGMVINNMQVIKTNNVPAGTVIACVKGAQGFGRNLSEVEALRLESQFGDAVRGLDQYGLATINADGIAKLLYTIA